LGIHYITGRSGSGKTIQVYREIGEAVQNGESRLILMVPEQFTLQAERDLIYKLNLPGILDVEVLSFSRLAHKVFNEVGGLTRTYINEQGRHMILRRLLDDLREQLTLYKTVSRQSGFISQINDLLTDLKKHDITPEQLRHQAEQMKGFGLLADKLQDTALIYEAFNQYLRDRYIDSEDAINALVDRMDQSRYLAGARIWLDGFDYYPPQTLRVLERLAVMAKELTITFTLEQEQENLNSDLFRVHSLSFDKIRAIAKEHHLKEQFTHLHKESDTSPELGHLERQLYQYPYQPYSREVDRIQIFAGSNPESEVERLAAGILSLSREKGWRFNEMTVVSGDLSVYGTLIKRIFNEYGIPCFIDEKRPVIQNPIVDLILTALRVTDRGYRYEDVFHLLKTGFCGLTIKQAELLENYCLEYGIKGRKWRQPFVPGEQDDSLTELNAYRVQFIQPLLQLEAALKSSESIQDMVTALYTYLENIHLQQQLEDWVEELKEQSEQLVDQLHEIKNVLSVFENASAGLRDLHSPRPCDVLQPDTWLDIQSGLKKWHGLMLTAVQSDLLSREADKIRTRILSLMGQTEEREHHRETPETRETMAAVEAAAGSLEDQVDAYLSACRAYSDYRKRIENRDGLLQGLKRAAGSERITKAFSLLADTGPEQILPMQDGSLLEQFFLIYDQYPVKESLEREFTGLMDEIRNQEQVLEECKKKIQATKLSLEQLSLTQELEQAHQRIHQGRNGLYQISYDYAVQKAAAWLCRQVRSEFMAKMKDDLLLKADGILSRLTGGNYQRMIPNDDLTDFSFVLGDGSHQENSRILSRGTREQVFLAVRLGRILEIQPALPVIIDDSLVNFDCAHLKQALAVIGRLSQTHQVFIMTCHPHLVGMLMDSGIPGQYWQLEKGRFSTAQGHELKEYLQLNTEAVKSLA
jgi:uncharacterized coiled-coil DUF342 family protein